MAWLNLKHVGSLIIHDMITRLCLWAIKQLVAMICTLYNMNFKNLLTSNCQGLFLKQGFLGLIACLPTLALSSTQTNN